MEKAVQIEQPRHLSGGGNGNSTKEMCDKWTHVNASRQEREDCEMGNRGQDGNTSTQTSGAIRDGPRASESPGLGPACSGVADWKKGK